MDETPLPRISVSTFDAETFVADEESTTGLEKSDGLKHQSLASNFQSDSHVTYPIDKDDYESKMEDDMLSDLGQLETSLSFSAFFKIVMMRTGTFSWHNKNIFCGWYDSQLTEKGKQEIYEASILLKNENYTFDLAFCSALSRCRESLDILLNELNLNDIEVHQTWELNERHCGGLTGYSNAELDAKYGREQVNFWLNSPNQSPPEMTKEHKFYDGVYGNPFLPTNIDLPRTESLKMMQDRFKNFWNKHVCPRILSGRKILLVTHNGGLQSLVHYLDDIEDINFFDTKIPRATPFYYKLDETLSPIYKDSYESLSFVMV